MGLMAKIWKHKKEQEYNWIDEERHRVVRRGKE